MTQNKFWELYDAGKINVKIFTGIVDGDVEKTIEAFEYEGKFYLRIITRYEWRTGPRIHKPNGYNMAGGHTSIKEFETKNQANAYFKKAGQGLSRVM